MTDKIEMEIEELKDSPLASVDWPLTEAGFFELFDRLERLETHMEHLRSAPSNSEDMRPADLKSARDARDAIKRWTHPEEMRARGRDWREIPLGQQQQQLILDSIVSREMDPQALPRHPGKRGIKAAIKQTLRQEHKNIFRSNYAFDAAWKALRKNGVIKDA